MKSAAYKAWILLCKNCNFDDDMYYNYGDNKFIPKGLFLLLVHCAYD